MKLVIGGGTRCGKSTLAEHIGRALRLPVYHADDLIHLGWSEASEAFADVIAHGRDGVYEGVATVRSLRKMMKRPRIRPCTEYVHLSTPMVALTPKQHALNAAIESVYREISPRLRARYVQVRVNSYLLNWEA